MCVVPTVLTGFRGENAVNPRLQDTFPNLRQIGVINFHFTV